MRNKNSIFKKILFRNLVVMIIPLALIMSILCYFMCSRYKKEEMINDNKVLSEYTQHIKNEIESSVQRSSYILKYNYIIDRLNANHLNTYNLLEFENNVKAYLDNITNDSGTVHIYTSNDELFEGKYISKLYRLDNYNNLQSRFINENTDFIWEDDIQTDENGNEYFLFYREMKLNNGSILACRVYIPSSQQNLDISIEKSDYPFIGDNYVREQLVNSFYVVMQLDYTKIYKKYTETILIFTLFSIMFIGALIYMSNYLTTKITSNIDSFITQLDESDILKADINLFANSDDSQELKVIKNTINSLVIKVKDISESQFKSELEKRSLKLNLLQSQIDPHTLYNSLSAIKLNAFLRNDTSTINLIDNMVSYYRAILNRGKDVVTLKDELEMIRKYIQINELSHGKQYKLILNVDEDLYNYNILHLMLQPFVENSIIHGLVGEKQNCIISISCKYIDEFLYITIEDNGYGIKPETLKKLENLDEYSGSYGIKNAYSRIKLAYGNDSEIKYRSEPDYGTKVTIKFRV